jgi:hypothetical protein
MGCDHWPSEMPLAGPYLDTVPPILRANHVGPAGGPETVLPPLPSIRTKSYWVANRRETNWWPGVDSPADHPPVSAPQCLNSRWNRRLSPE